MICPNCRQLVTNGAAKCPRCGAEMPVRESPQPSAPQQPQAPYGAQPGMDQQPAFGNAPQMPPQGQAQTFQPQQPGGYPPQQPVAGPAPQNQPYMPPQGSYQQPYPGYPYPPKAPGSGKASAAMGFGIASLVCSIFLTVVGIPLGIAAVICGVLARKENPYITKAVPGIVMGIIGTAVSTLLIILAVVLFQGMFSLYDSYEDWNTNTNTYNYNYNFNYGYNTNSNSNSGSGTTPVIPDEPEGFIGKWYLVGGKYDGEELEADDLKHLAYMKLDANLTLTQTPSAAVLTLGYESYRGVWSQTGMEHGTLELSGGNKYEMSLEDYGASLVVSGGETELRFSAKPLDLTGYEDPSAPDIDTEQARFDSLGDATKSSYRDGYVTLDSAYVLNESLVLSDNDTFKLELVAYGEYIGSPCYAFKLTNKGDEDIKGWVEEFHWKVDGKETSALGVMDDVSPGKSSTLPVYFYDLEQQLSGNTKVEGNIRVFSSDTFETIGSIDISIG